jgi:hypothetical protein
MDEPGRSQFLINIDDELLKGGVTFSEWCSFIICESDTAFIAGADLATIITAMAGIETYLRSEYPMRRKANLFDLIEESPLADDLKCEIHALRTYRNRWVHVANPEDDQDLQDHPDRYAHELEDMARRAVRTLRRTIYENQWV